MLDQHDNAEREKVLRWIDAQQDALLSETLRLANINSGTQNLEGLAQMHDALMALFAPLADEAESIPLIPTTQIADSGKEQAVHYGNALSFKKRPHAPLQVLFCGHMDTVFPKAHPFQTCTAFTTEDGDRRINGPGTADMKAGLMVILHTLKAWEQHPLAEQVGWQVLINADEETGSIGSAALIRERATQAHMGMVYEPALADGTLAGERKGSGNFTLKITGKSAHAGREFEVGRNAIAAQAQAMSFLHQLNRQREGITVNLGRVSGGVALNVVADNAVCHFNIRSQTLADQAWAQQQLEALLGAIHHQTSLAGYSFEDGLTAALSGQFNRPPKPLSPPAQQLFSWLKACGQQLDITIAHQPTGGCCDGNNLAAAGLPNIDTLGVRGGDIHTPHEFMCIASLTERTQLSLLLLETFAQQGKAYLQELKKWREHKEISTC
jgi:glutamate carboxypeptidase